MMMVYSPAADFAESITKATWNHLGQELEVPMVTRCLIAERHQGSLDYFKLLLLDAVDTVDMLQVDNLPSLVQAVSRYQPGLLFLDWCMTGSQMQDEDLADILLYERIKSWRCKSPGLKVFALTHHPRQEKQARSLGADGILPLNVPPDVMKARLGATVRAYQALNFRYNQ